MRLRRCQSAGPAFGIWVKWCLPISFCFFKAKGGIRDVAVTGVQTCALPICGVLIDDRVTAAIRAANEGVDLRARRFRSEERRVGRECRSWWSPYHYKKE